MNLLKSLARLFRKRPAPPQRPYYEPAFLLEMQRRTQTPRMSDVRTLPKPSPAPHHFFMYTPIRTPHDKGEC